ncbi:MAG: histidine phosphatase family protein [Candidatus Pacebacteria bacterium]|nr:histidine phosphatase family protein [Candidatus Paceibacterota bacterium]
MSIDVIFLRHGNDDAKGPEDEESSLTNEGICQIERVARNLRETKLSAVYASPLLRTIETGEIVCKTLGIKRPIVLDWRLCYRNKNSPLEEFVNGYNNAIAKISSYKDLRTERTVQLDWVQVWPRKAKEIQDNVLDFMKEISEIFEPGSIILAVSHGGVIEVASPFPFEKTPKKGEGLIFHFCKGKIRGVCQL